MRLVPGTKLGPYEIVSLVGEGETGDVCKATDSQSNRTVAVKVVTQRDDDKEMRERLPR